MFLVQIFFEKKFEKVENFLKCFFLKIKKNFNFCLDFLFQKKSKQFEWIKHNVNENEFLLLEKHILEVLTLQNWWKQELLWPKTQNRSYFVRKRSFTPIFGLFWPFLGIFWRTQHDFRSKKCPKMAIFWRKNEEKFFFV